MGTPHVHHHRPPRGRPAPRAIYFAEWDAGVSDPSRYYRGSTRAIDRVEDPHGDDIRVEIYSSQSVAGDVTRLIAFDEGTMSPARVMGPLVCHEDGTSWSSGHGPCRW